MFRARFPTSFLSGCLALACLGTVKAQVPPAPAEDDDFANVPIVLTASRLKQPLNEAPGAMTVVDRKTIRLSGARTLADVLRLVPGYMSGGWNGANPLAAYHLPLDDYGTRNLVLIDGRPVYSSLYLGDTHRGMMDVMLEDIERIEVLRGANSAAYGANAMFGVINIITRHSADAPTAELSATSGGNGIDDHRVQLGGRLGKDATFRVSAGDQRDQGYLNVHDDMHLSVLDGRLDFKPTAADDIMMSAGVSYLLAGEGFAESLTNPLRTIQSKDTYLNARWQHQVSDTDQWQLSLSYMEDWKQDRAPFALVPQVSIDFGGIGFSNNIELQRKTSLGDGLRAVAGVGYREDQGHSKALYSTTGTEGFHEERVFGTIEWRATPHWLFNGGLFIGEHSLAGTYAAPRLMANWLISPEHTLRAGVTESVRTPSPFEYAGDVRYELNGMLLGETWKARGGVKPERLNSQEIGYLGRFAASQLTLDVRAYHERMKSIIRNTAYNDDFVLPFTTGLADFENFQGFDLVGIEYQMRWKPFSSGELWLNQSFEHLNWDFSNFNRDKERLPPEHATTIAWFQQLPAGMELTVIHQVIGGMTWRNADNWIRVSHRTDVRLAYPFRLHNMRAELSCTAQSIQGDQPTFLTSKQFLAPRRSFVQLKLEI